MDKILNAIATIMIGIIVILLIALLMAYPTMWLWNGLMPDIFKLPKIEVTQALGLLILCGLLFKNSSSSK